MGPKSSLSSLISQYRSLIARLLCYREHIAPVSTARQKLHTRMHQPIFIHGNNTSGMLVEEIHHTLQTHSLGVIQFTATVSVRSEAPQESFRSVDFISAKFHDHSIMYMNVLQQVRSKQVVATGFIQLSSCIVMIMSFCFVLFH